MRCWQGWRSPPVVHAALSDLYAYLLPQLLFFSAGTRLAAAGDHRRSRRVLAGDWLWPHRRGVDGGLRVFPSRRGQPAPPGASFRNLAAVLRAGRDLFLIAGGSIRAGFAGAHFRGPRENILPARAARCAGTPAAVTGA